MPAVTAACCSCLLLQLPWLMLVFAHAALQATLPNHAIAPPPSLPICRSDIRLSAVLSESGAQLATPPGVVAFESGVDLTQPEDAAPPGPLTGPNDTASSSTGSGSGDGGVPVGAIVGAVAGTAALAALAGLCYFWCIVRPKRAAAAEAKAYAEAAWGSDAAAQQADHASFSGNLEKVSCGMPRQSASAVYWRCPTLLNIARARLLCAPPSHRTSPENPLPLSLAGFCRQAGPSGSKEAGLGFPTQCGRRPAGACGHPRAPAAQPPAQPHIQPAAARARMEGFNQWRGGL